MSLTSLLQEKGASISKRATTNHPSRYRILVINPGSTSLKLLCQNHVESLSQEISKLGSLTITQLMDLTRYWLQDIGGLQVSDLDAVAFMPGAGLQSVNKLGIYGMDAKMLDDLNHPTFDHASNNAGIIAYSLVTSVSGKEIPCYTQDLITTHQLCPEASVSGHARFPRIQRIHALNLTSALRKAAEELEINFDRMNAIGVQWGGGIGLAGLRNGRYEDFVDAGGESMSPNRSGGPHFNVMRMVDYMKAEREAGRDVDPKVLEKMLMKTGGLMSYTGTDDVEVIQNIRENVETAKAYYAEKKDFFNDLFRSWNLNVPEASAPKQVMRLCGLVLNSMLYQIGKEVGGLRSSLFAGESLDAIVVTGGIAKSKALAHDLKVKYLDQFEEDGTAIRIYPGQDELEVLRDGAIKALENPGIVHNYSSSIIQNPNALLFK